MVQRSPVERVAENPFVAAGIALVIIAVAVAFAVIDSSDEDTRSELAQSEDGPTVPGSSGARPTATTGGAVGTEAGERWSDGTIRRRHPRASRELRPGRAPPRRSARRESPTTRSRSDRSSPTPTRSPNSSGRPLKDSAHSSICSIDSGGLCGRKLKIEYRNDNLNPATHNQDARELAARVLAFVGNESLLDFLDYEREPPFEPTVQGGGGKVPDVGGLAFGYGRSQSRWHAGVIGSVSPVLVGGGQYKSFVNEAKAARKPCRKGAVVYLREPTGASEDQARLGQVSIEQSWGGNLGRGKTSLYAANLLDPVPAYEALVDRMVADGMNCVFTYTDLQSSINMAQAMNNRGVWPPDKCDLGPQCFSVFSVVLSVYDRRFIQDAGEGARFVSTFIPHVPLTETDNASLKVYLDAISRINGARPSTFSILAFSSGLMLVDALQACPEAPTRACLMDALQQDAELHGGRAARWHDSLPHDESDVRPLRDVQLEVDLQHEHRDARPRPRRQARLLPHRAQRIPERPASRRARQTGLSSPVPLEVRGVVVDYGGLRALDRVTLTVEPGQTVGLIGPNGAGKTTLFDCILGLVRPVKGHVRLFETDVNGWAVHRRARLGLGRTFQRLELFGSLTVAENVIVALESMSSVGGLVGELLRRPDEHRRPPSRRGARRRTARPRRPHRPRRHPVRRPSDGPRARARGRARARHGAEAVVARRTVVRIERAGV